MNVTMRLFSKWTNIYPIEKGLVFDFDECLVGPNLPNSIILAKI